mgnify:CR=1 FL=1
MLNIRNALIVVLALFCATALVAQDFMPAPDISARAEGKTAIKKAGAGAKTGAYSQAELLDSLEMGCDALIRWQHTDGGWLWTENFGSTSTATSANQKGVVARALILIDQKIPGNDYIGDGSYPGAAFTGEKLMENVVLGSDRFYGPDTTFMVELSDATGNMDYKTSATQEWNYKRNNVGAYSTAWTLTDYFITNRCSNGYFSSGWGYGLCIWDLAGYAAAAEKVGDHAYAQQIIDYLANESDFSNPPTITEAHWNDTANGYNKTVFHNFLKRWDDNTATSSTAEKEWGFIVGAGHMMWAMNIVDPIRYYSWIEEFKTRIAAAQETDTGNPNFGGYTYAKLGWDEVAVQDQGYAMMGMRNVGAVESGMKATEWAINNQETTGDAKGMWSTVRHEPNSECLQGMWEVAEGEQKPWISITVHPQGNHVNQVPVSFKVYDIQSNSATIKVEWTRDGGATWNLTSNVTGATTGLAASPSGVEHSIIWESYPEIPEAPPAEAQANCKIRITARDNSLPGSWGSPAGVTSTFSVDNRSVPVELSIFSVE